MIESFVAINIYNDKEGKKELFNEIPLLFYCDDMDNFKNDLLADEKFRKLVENSCLNVNNYTTSYIGYFYFNGDNEYEDTCIPIQELFPSDNLLDTEKYFTKEYISSIFINLYEVSMHIQYENNLMFDIDATIKDIYQILKKKFKEKIIKSTVINYVRSELNKKDLSKENINYIIGELETILKDEE